MRVGIAYFNFLNGMGVGSVLELSDRNARLRSGRGGLRLLRRRIGLEQAGKQEGRRRHALCCVDAAAAGADKNQRRNAKHSQHFPI